MWLNRFTNYLLSHRWQAIFFTFIITFIPVLGIVGILIAAFVTLCKGAIEGAILTIAATIPYLGSFYLSKNPEAALPIVVWAGVGVAILSNILTWIFAVMLRREVSWSVILQIATLFGVLVVSVVHLIYPEVATWWGDQLQSYYNHAQALLKNNGAAGQDTQIETINITKQYATGLMMAAILFNAILQLVVARWWQAIIYTPGSLRKELHAVRLSKLAGLLFIISLVFSYLGNRVVLDIMPILYLLFASAGLSLIHYLFGQLQTNTAWFWLSILYIAILFSLPVSLILISAFALLDIWLNIRKRYKKTY